MVRLPVAVASLVLVALAGCASAPTVATPVDAGPAQPKVAAYTCGDLGNVTIEHNGSSIRMRDPYGAILDLPASPAGQQNRFGNGADAVVVEGREALIMQGNHEPLTCTR